MEREERFYQYGGTLLVATRYKGAITLECVEDEKTLPEGLRKQFDSFREIDRKLDK